MAFPVKLTPAAALVLSAPLKVVVPVAESIVNEAALRRAAETLAALTISTVPRHVVAPAEPVNVIFPVPAVRVRFWAPSRVLENKIFPAPAPVFSVVVPVRVVPVENVMLSSVVVIPPEKETKPAPF